MTIIRRANTVRYTVNTADGISKRRRALSAYTVKNTVKSQLPGLSQV